MSVIKSIPNLTKEEFQKVLKQVPTTTIEVIIKTENGVLLGKRNTEPFKGMWHLTGGFIHYDEHIHDAVKRIGKRETGVDIEIVKLLGVYEYIHDDPRGHIIGLAYIVRVAGGKIAPNSDNSDLRFFSAPPDGMIPYQRKIVEDALRLSYTKT